MDASLTLRLFGVSSPEEKAESPVSSAIDTSPEIQSSDENLIALIQQGSREALSALFQRYARSVRGIAYRVLRDTSEADDLVQEIFLLINRKCGTFDPARGPARFWILQMAYSRALVRRRYLNSRHFYTRVDLDDANNQIAIGDNGHRSSQDGLLSGSAWDGILEALSEDQRETLRLFFVEGYTLGEIAIKLNQTRCNVKNHYFRGLERLRKQFFQNKLRRNSAV